MRIISGAWKGRRLKSVRGIQTRPTSDKVKGAIFNILGDKISGAKVLDLFAGTGNLSYEALSRGAVYAVLVENSSKALETIRDNQALLGAEEKSKIYLMNAFSFLNNNQHGKFDIIFLDPPYHQDIVRKILSILANNYLLNANGVLVIETASDEEIGEVFPFEVMLTKVYGDTKIWFLQEAEEQGEG